MIISIVEIFKFEQTFSRNINFFIVSMHFEDVFVYILADEAVDLNPHLETSINLGDHAFTQMQGDLDRQRLLGERPLSDPLADLLKQMQHKER